VGWSKTNCVKAYVKVTEENYPLLGILDALKDIKIYTRLTSEQCFKNIDA
jgi:hypothetical protein